MIEPRVLKGFRDALPERVSARQAMVRSIQSVYERYGFLPFDTPAIEYVDVLGKYLAETDTPEGGIFAFRDEQQEWIGLRYDLTASLSRVVAMYQQLPMPFKRYQVGPVWRKEKPGPGRFREFFQMDFDTVGVPGMMADAEACCVIADVLEGLGVARGDYAVRVNNRKVLNGVLEACGVAWQAEGGGLSTTGVSVLRAIDKQDRIGVEGVRRLLGEGRMDESGDFTPGAGLTTDQIDAVLGFLDTASQTRVGFCDATDALLGDSEIGREGVRELREIDELLANAGYDEERVVFDPSIVRGLGYYTGPVFEADLTRPIVVDGEEKRFGSVFGGGRYDDLVERFTGKKVPATGAAIGVDRLLEAMLALGAIAGEPPSVVLITVLDRSRIADYQAMAAEIRAAGMNAELYAGSAGIGGQLKYADRSAKKLAVIAGEDEFSQGEVSIKDLELGRQLAAGISERKEWLESQPAQFSVPRERLVSEVRRLLDRPPDLSEEAA